MVVELGFDLQPAGTSAADLTVQVRMEPRGGLRLLSPLFAFQLPRRSDRITRRMIELVAARPAEAGWPDIKTRFVLCRNDRFFPARWLRPLVRDRLGIEPAGIDSCHCPALSRPRELAGLLDRYSTATTGRDRSV